MFSPYAAMGNAPESMVDPNGTLATYSSDGVRNDMLSGNVAGYSGAELADISRDASRGGSGPGSFSDRIWGGGMSQVMANAAAIVEKAKNDAEKTTGESKTQGDGKTVSNLGSANNGTPPRKGGVGPFTDDDSERAGSTVQIYIWDKESGKDVGHTAIKIGDNVYGYYPTDENENGGYDKGELFGSKGEMHINTTKEFSQLYNGQAITSFDIELTRKQAASLQANLDKIASNPGTYSLRGNNCTSVAVTALINSGVTINAPTNQGDRPIWTGKITPLKNGFGL